MTYILPEPCYDSSPPIGFRLISSARRSTVGLQAWAAAVNTCNSSVGDVEIPAGTYATATMLILADCAITLRAHAWGEVTLRANGGSVFNVQGQLYSLSAFVHSLHPTLSPVCVALASLEIWA